MAEFLADIQSENADTRFAAWRRAGDAPPSSIPELGRLAASNKPGVSKAAREALTTMTHAVGKDPAAPKRAAVVKELLDIAGPAYSLPVRAHALRMLSSIAGEDSVPSIAKWLAGADTREEAVYCVERIPGAASIKALLAAYKDAGDEFKPRLLAALGHRRAPEAVALCLEAMRSANVEIAVAATKAFGRIGKKPATPPRYPDTKAHSAWQKIDEFDSMLRYADAQAKEGNGAEAMRVYKAALDRTEEHWQCAAIIGIAKLGTAEAAAAILPKLKSENRTVRITAEKAWKGMAGA